MSEGNGQQHGEVIAVAIEFPVATVDVKKEKKQEQSVH